MTEYDKIKFRDDCAIAAMQVYNRLYYYDKIGTGAVKDPDATIAQWSYGMAEAMLKEKLKRDEK